MNKKKETNQLPTHKMLQLCVDDYKENPDMLLEAFKKKALFEKWDVVEINAVIQEATKNLDHDHLIETIREYCKY